MMREEKDLSKIKKKKKNLNLIKSFFYLINFRHSSISLTQKTEALIFSMKSREPLHKTS